MFTEKYLQKLQHEAEQSLDTQVNFFLFLQLRMRVRKSFW